MKSETFLCADNKEVELHRTYRVSWGNITLPNVSVVTEEVDFEDHSDMLDFVGALFLNGAIAVSVGRSIHRTIYPMRSDA